MYNGVTGLLEDEDNLDPVIEFDFTALHYVFLPLINDKFDAW